LFTRNFISTSENVGATYATLRSPAPSITYRSHNLEKNGEPVWLSRRMVENKRKNKRSRVRSFAKPGQTKKKATSGIVDVPYQRALIIQSVAPTISMALIRDVWDPSHVWDPSRSMYLHRCLWSRHSDLELASNVFAHLIVSDNLSLSAWHWLRWLICGRQSRPVVCWPSKKISSSLNFEVIWPRINAFSKSIIIRIVTTVTVHKIGLAQRYRFNAWQCLLLITELSMCNNTQLLHVKNH
jgi:hypothetical protein